MRPFPDGRKWCQKEFPCLAQFMWQQLSIRNCKLSNNRYQVAIIRRLVSAWAMPLLLGDNYYIFKCGALASSIKSITFSARMLFQSISNGKLWGCTIYVLIIGNLYYESSRNQNWCPSCDKGSFLLSFLPPIGTTSVTPKAGDNSGVAHPRSA